MIMFLRVENVINNQKQVVHCDRVRNYDDSESMVSEDINYGAAFSRQFLFSHDVNKLIEIGLIHH